jgi:acetyltransferase-like isoleucine patch superfamily enzyme
MSSLLEMWDNGRAVLRAYWYFRRATELGIRARVWGKPVIRNKGQMVIGERFRLISTVAKTELGVGADGRLEIGNRVLINYGCSIAATRLVRIGDDCMLGTHVLMMDNDFHRMEPDRRTEMPESKPIIVENNVWIGGRVIVLCGVTIGHDSVIGAGSIVTKDIPPLALAVGSPARVIKSF